MSLRWRPKSGFRAKQRSISRPSQSVPAPHGSPPIPRNPCSNAAADPTTQRYAPPPNAAAAPQNCDLSRCVTQSPIGRSTAPEPIPATHHDTRHRPKSAAAGRTCPPVLSAPAGRHPDPAHPPDAPPPPAAPRCAPKDDACAPSLFARVVAEVPLFSVVFTDWLSTTVALGSEWRP